MHGTGVKVKTYCLNVGKIKLRLKLAKVKLSCVHPQGYVKQELFHSGYQQEDPQLNQDCYHIWHCPPQLLAVSARPRVELAREE